jgi:hypothetical protein
LLLSPCPTGYVSSRASSCTPACQFCKKLPQFFKKYRSQPVNPNPLYLPTSPSAPPRSLCPSSTPPPPLTFSLLYAATSPHLLPLRLLFVASPYAPPPQPRLLPQDPDPTRGEARSGSDGATARAPGASVRESLSVRLPQPLLCTVVEIRGGAGRSMPTQALPSRPEGAGDFRREVACESQGASGDRSGPAAAAGEGGRGARSA